MKSDKTKLKILEENASTLKIKFPSIDIPISVSQRYYEKIKLNNEYIIEPVNYSDSILSKSDQKQKNEKHYESN